MYAGIRARPRVVYWNNIPSPYTVSRLNAVVNRGNIDLDVWFDERTEPDRSWTVDESTWLFPFRYLPRFGIGGHRISIPVQVLGSARPDLFVSLYSRPPYVVAQGIANARGWRTALISLTTFDSWNPRSRWREALKRWVFSHSDAVMTSGADGCAFAAKYGAPADRIHVVRPVTDPGFFAAGAAAARATRDFTRAQWRLNGTVFIYVGRLWSGKGIRPLLDAYDAVAADSPGRTTLLILGDGPEEAAVRARAAVSGPGRIVLAGFHQQPELPAFYAAADVFVFPTLGDPYGLVVDEAMAAGLPIVSTTSAGEIQERVYHGINGYLVPPGNSAALASAMRRTVDDSVSRTQMGERSAELIAPFTPDQWAVEFEHFVEAVLSKRKLRCRPYGVSWPCG